MADDIGHGPACAFCSSARGPASCPARPPARPHINSEDPAGDEYTPATEDVRLVFGSDSTGMLRDDRVAAFDRWLAAHDREVAAHAWDEGFSTSDRCWAETYDLTTPDEDRTDPSNPYRAEAFADAWARTHPKEDAMSTPDLTITTIPDADALRAYLDAVGTPSPSLHPRVNGEDGYGPNSRWNGWNYTEAAGVDAEGRPFQPMLHHYAHPNSGIACSSGQGSLLSHDHRRAWERVAFPVYLLPAKANVLHPEYTPDWS